MLVGLGALLIVAAFLKDNTGRSQGPSVSPSACPGWRDIRARADDSSGCRVVPAILTVSLQVA